MDDFIVYENFLPVVRKSLYGTTPSRVKENHGNLRQSKKVKFGTDLDSSDLEAQNSQNLKNRKATPFIKRLKKVKIAQNENGSGKKRSRKYKKAVSVDLKKKKPKIKKVVISYSNSSESSNDDEQLTPSKSEMEIFQNTFNKSSKRESYNGNDLTSDDESSDNFDLETYFNTRDISDLNESITEAHSGIDHEFVSEYAKNVKIFESESVKGRKNKEETTNDNNSSLDSEKYFIEDNISGDENITSITEKIQESMIISDDDYVETSFNTITQEEHHQEEEIPNEFCSAEYYEFEDKKIVVLNENQTVSFHGLFKLKVLHGKIDIVGHVLDKNSKEVDLYSPRGSALLYVKNTTQNEDYENDLKNTYGISLNANCAAFLCTKLEDSKINFIEKYIPQKLFPKLENDNMPQVCFEPTENLNLLKSSSAWNEILNNITSNTKLMITGGKGVGKSTLLRFAINKLLNKFLKVKVLDLDPGQSEFAVPGCLSVVTVTEPVLGPNFTHLRPTDRSLLSNTNVGHDPRAYLKCIRSLMLYLETLEEECPLLINYMGFVQGIGLNIISTAIKDIRPTDIIQIQSKNNNRNFKADLTPKTVETNCKLFSENNKTSLDYSELKYKLHKVAAMNDGNDGWTLKPRQSREMYVLTYFGQMMQNDVNSLTSHELPMYEIKLSEIKITDLKGEEIIPAAANANMVALCSLEKDSNIFVCFGYGIIRGIDLGCNKLVLVTPEPANVLEEVYYLVMASVSLPPSIYMTPDDVTGIVPYVMEGELVSLGQITKRSYLPVNKK